MAEEDPAASLGLEGSEAEALAATKIQATFRCVATRRVFSAAFPAELTSWRAWRAAFSQRSGCARRRQHPDPGRGARNHG